MNLRDRLDQDLKDAIRGKDSLRKSVVRILRSDIHNEEIAIQKSLDDEGIVGVISRQVRQRRESITEFRKGNREDLVAKEEQELSTLLEYLPDQLDYSQISEMVDEVIRSVGANSSADKGRVMGALMPKLKGRADGSIVNEIVTKLLVGSGD